MRTLALLSLLVPILALGCASTEAVAPSKAGTWRVGGSSGGFFRTTDQGTVGDRLDYGAELTLGRFVSSRVLLEVAVDAAFSDQEVEGEADLETSGFSAIGGFRYYFEHEGRSRPYFGLGGGISTLDFRGEGFKDHDTSLAVVGRLGYETFLSRSVTLDFGVRIQHTFDRELFGVEEDVTEGAFLIGLAAWF